MSFDQLSLSLSCVSPPFHYAPVSPSFIGYSIHRACFAALSPQALSLLGDLFSFQASLNAPSSSTCLRGKRPPLRHHYTVHQFTSTDLCTLCWAGLAYASRLSALCFFQKNSRIGQLCLQLIMATSRGCMTVAVEENPKTGSRSCSSFL